MDLQKMMEGLFEGTSQSEEWIRAMKLLCFMHSELGNVAYTKLEDMLKSKDKEMSDLAINMIDQEYVEIYGNTENDDNNE